MLLIWAFGGNTNINQRNFARAYLIVTIGFGVIFGIVFGVIVLSAAIR
jgi:hypothetical protein